MVKCFKKMKYLYDWDISVDNLKIHLPYGYCCNKKNTSSRLYPIIWYACNITINVTITFQVLCCLEQNWLFHQPVLLNVTLDIHMSRQFPIIKIYPSSKSLWNSFYYDVVIIYTFALPLMPNTSILSFWQLFLNPASPNNYMSVRKRNTSIMRNSCSSLSTSFALHKRTWVFVWWRYKSCCWVVKQPTN